MQPQVTLAHTADLAADQLSGIRALLDTAFEGEFDAQDWDHALGGLHVLLTGEDGLLAHGAVIQRRVRHAGRSLRVGYVEAVAVRPELHRSGHGGRIMAAAERVIDAAYELGALSASDAGAALYRSRGWQVWPGRIGALGPDGPLRLPDEEGSTFLREVPGGPQLDAEQGLFFDWRDGDVL
ncbi:GNAT family N-acetyltransferase [Streptomyces sp. NA04227]|uniref:GNAT family N-acetyltransferase n=1 Tax=Streptomyces sp. NA04227 TaxID=2742136 RepID=UPI001590C4FA|nr:GNAT family N-acetyltransferase [Streptomyces sp. NA04227]QKW09380.1 GNAT family N-acetyltransferase [Streptomyces sp. NA04227]